MENSLIITHALNMNQNVKILTRIREKRVVTGMVVELGPHAESKLLQVWNFFLVLHVLIEQLLVHGDFVNAAGVSHLARRTKQAHFVA